MGDTDIPVLAKMCDGIHEFGSLAGAELNHAGQMSPNRYSRSVPLSPSHIPVASHEPLQAREMDLQDIKNLRKWHRDAAIRAVKAGFQIREFHHTFWQELVYQYRPIIALQPTVNDHQMGVFQFLPCKLRPILPLL